MRMRSLPRLPIYFSEAPVCVITAGTEKRDHSIANKGAHEVFRVFCSNARERGACVGRYVLMPDHLHLFVCIPPGEMGLSM
jgi:REP element-mobilizing transposase RayT